MKAASGTTAYVRLHLRFGWRALLVFLLLGVVLEALHGFKVGWYLDVSNEARRMTWTLAHVHGVLLALLQVAFALTLHARSGSAPEAPWLRVASPALIAANVLLPGGFFLAGTFLRGNAPGPALLVVPIGGLFLLVGVLLVARSAGRG